MKLIQSDTASCALRLDGSVSKDTNSRMAAEDMR
jgi:hypothetical protein